MRIPAKESRVGAGNYDGGILALLDGAVFRLRRIVRIGPGDRNEVAVKVTGHRWHSAILAERFDLVEFGALYDLIAAFAVEDDIVGAEGDDGRCSHGPSSQGDYGEKLGEHPGLRTRNFSKTTTSDYDSERM